MKRLLVLMLIFSCQVSAQGTQPQGKIIAIQGHVDHAQANRDVWNPAQLAQSLFIDERVRTLTASRTAILFIDETQVKLNAGAVLTVQAIRRGGGSTNFNLLQGEGWFRTKNPAGTVTIATPAASASLRGTEINVEIRGDQTVLTVTEGSVEFSNPQGSLTVNAGEEATAVPGQPPTKRVLLNPEDAVQWALYYPATIAWHDLPQRALDGAARTGFDRLKAGEPAEAVAAFQSSLASDVWSRVGASMAYAELGDAIQARAVLGDMPPPAVNADERIAYYSQLAAAALAAGAARGARRELENALAIDRTAVRPLVLLSTLELTQNRKEEAMSAARAAVDAHPDSVAACIAAAEAAQAAFDLHLAQNYLDRALNLDPNDVRALVDRARIRFGSGDTRRAERDVADAARFVPNDAQLRSLAGFIKLARGDNDGAEADFNTSIQADAAFGEPHLGLGLLNFNRLQLNEGLLEMLTATLLEPKVSLYQSYLGKAYYQLKRFPEGLAALDTAKRLDPRDPTPGYTRACSSAT